MLNILDELIDEVILNTREQGLKDSQIENKILTIDRKELKLKYMEKIGDWVLKTMGGKA